MSRKTVHVENVREWANNMLSASFEGMQVERLGIIALVEKILHETDNYKGFRCTALPSDWDYEAPYDQAKWDNVDETRRYYY